MHPLLTILGLLALGFALLNVMAYRHAYRMLHFVDAGDRTEAPERLTILNKIKTLLVGVNIPRPESFSTPADFELAYTTHRFESGPGIQLEGWFIPREQSKGLILLFHGYASCKGALLEDARAFHELGFSTLTIDFRGSGGSSGRSTSVGYLEAVDVAKTLEYARRTWPEDQTALYGSSMGAAAVLRAISAEGIQPDAVIIEAVFDRMISTVENRFRAMKIPAFPCAQLLTFWGGAQMRFPGLKHNPVDYAVDVKCPALLLHGTEDPRATINQAEAVFKNLNGPKTFEKFEGTGHESCLNAEPEKWKRAVSEFLQD